MWKRVETQTRSLLGGVGVEEGGDPDVVTAG